jgi:acetolactate synthase regulatory subunit
MNERIRVDFLSEEGAARRLLGLVEQRGFAILGIEMREQPCGVRAVMALDIAPRHCGKSPDLLVRQLNRLHGVVGTSLETASFSEKAA